MTLRFLILQTPPNGPNDQRHRVIPDGQNGHLTDAQIAELRELHGETFGGIMEASNIHRARKKLECPACDAGRRNIREIGF